MKCVKPNIPSYQTAIQQTCKDIDLTGMESIPDEPDQRIKYFGCGYDDNYFIQGFKIYDQPNAGIQNCDINCWEKMRCCKYDQNVINVAPMTTYNDAVNNQNWGAYCFNIGYVDQWCKADADKFVNGMMFYQSSWNPGNTDNIRYPVTRRLYLKPGFAYTDSPKTPSNSPSDTPSTSPLTVQPSDSPQQSPSYSPVKDIGTWGSTYGSNWGNSFGPLNTDGETRRITGIQMSAGSSRPYMLRFRINDEWMDAIGTYESCAGCVQTMLLQDDEYITQSNIDVCNGRIDYLSFYSNKGQNIGDGNTAHSTGCSDNRVPFNKLIDIKGKERNGGDFYEIQFKSE